MENKNSLDLDLAINFFENLLNFLNDYRLIKNNSKFKSDTKEIDFDDLNWPPAIPPSLVCDSQSDIAKLERAEGIIETFFTNEDSKLKILDFGCGEGHVTFNLLKNNKNNVYGYDIKKYNNYYWNTYEEFITDNINLIKQKAPYDIIFLYDVVDHMEDCLNTFKIIKDVLAKDGKIIMRCHPWCSRHGGHLFQKNNKAFIHLFLDSDPEIFIKKTIFPLATYRDMIKNLNLEIVSESVEKQNVEEYFQQEKLKKIILQKWNRKENEEFPVFQLEQNFIDYVLKKI